MSVSGEQRSTAEREALAELAVFPLLKRIGAGPTPCFVPSDVPR